MRFDRMSSPLRCVRVLFVLYLLSGCGLSSAWAVSAQSRVALLIAHNSAGKRAKALRYAVSDARKMKNVLIQVAGYKADNIFLSLNQSVFQVTRMFAKVKAKIKALRKARGGGKVILLLYYSGHAREGHFFLGDTTMSFATLRQFLKHSGATLRLALLDTCSSGRFLETRGIKYRKKSFHIPFLNTESAKGEAIITSTGHRENAYEDLKLRGGIFTHYVSTGLRGAADRNRDGRVTLEELYAFVYHRTINRTVFARSGPQKPHFRTNIRGAGQVILSTMQRELAKLHFQQKLKGQFFIWDRHSTLYAGFRKRPNRAVRLAMQPGHYHIQWRYGKRIFSSRIKLNKDQIFYLGRKQGKLAFFRGLSRRGATPPTAEAWSVLEGKDVTPFVGISWTGGVSSSSFLGTPAAGGGRLGIESTFWAFQLGFWGTSLSFTDAQGQSFASTQLLLDLRLSGGYRFLWEKVSLYTGAFAGIGWLGQHVNIESRSGLLLQAGVLLTPTYWFHPRWGITAPISLGIDVGQAIAQWEVRFHWAASLGVAFRI